ncbi:hypothetical protein PMIN01_08471 [Paraphaeosphaeria minitans]|uniref:Uncharacterized protein n=1 Tax=Paraphaeosphaeria minitans TaxID=565426 RepID=A0A9P6GFI0_9PLEO|nr:hypothetical protein PMIN01_08471 [Paraphaeosphaeria minitans]
MPGLVNSIQSILGKLWTNTTNGLNKMLPPDKRDELLSKLQQLANNNPKLAVGTLTIAPVPLKEPHRLHVFLATHVVLTGVPILLFTLFTLSIFVFSLVTALLASILAAVFFTFFMVSVALLFLVPTLFLATFTASFLFLWGLAGWYVVKWFTQGADSVLDRKSISDRVDRFTGSRAGWVSSGASEKREITLSDDGQDAKWCAKDHDDSDGRDTGRALEKVTESLRDETNHSPNRSPVKILKIVDVDENAARTEKPALPAAKETVGGAVES